MPLKKVSELQIGDLVDLEGDKFADPDRTGGEEHSFSYELQEVGSITHETENCIAIGFEGFDVVGFPPDHLLFCVVPRNGSGDQLEGR